MFVINLNFLSLNLQRPNCMVNPNKICKIWTSTRDQIHKAINDVYIYGTSFISSWFVRVNPLIVLWA
jgi:hypothetical protein